MNQKAGKILMVDDDEFVRLSLKVLLDDHYQCIDWVENPAIIESKISSTAYDVVLLDMNFTPGDTSGKEGLKWL